MLATTSCTAPQNLTPGAFTQEPRSLVSCAQGVPPHPQVPDEGRWVLCVYRRKAEKAAAGTVLWQKLVLSSAAAQNSQSSASDDGTSSSAFQVAWGAQGQAGTLLDNRIHSAQPSLPYRLPPAWHTEKNSSLSAQSYIHPQTPTALGFYLPACCPHPNTVLPSLSLEGQGCPLLAGTVSGCRTDCPRASFCPAPAKSVPPFPHHPSQPLEVTVLASDEVPSSSCLATCQWVPQDPHSELHPSASVVQTGVTQLLRGSEPCQSVLPISLAIEAKATPRTWATPRSTATSSTGSP